MRLDKMTTQLQTAINDAQSLAVAKDNTTIEIEHLLHALITSRAVRCDRCWPRPVLIQRR